MQISRLNPFGYEATTEKGNKYKATNKIGAILGTVGIAVGGIDYLRNESEMCSKEIKGEFDLPPLKINKKEAGLWKSLGVLAVIIDAGIMIGIGHWIDKKTNKIRAYKADEKAEKLNTNA